MFKYENQINLFASVMGTLLVSLFGKPNHVLIYMFILIGCDYITGIIAGAYQNKLSSKTCFKGLLKKATILIVVIIAARYDIMNNDSGFTVRNIVCLFYAGNEGLSIIENLIKLDVPIPAKIKNMFTIMKEGENNEGVK